MRARQVLLTGASGYLGGYLLRELRRQPGVTVRTAGRRGADLTVDLEDPDAAAAAAAAAAPDLLLHAAALSSLSACDRDPELAERVNAAAPAAFAAAVPRLVLVSTDLVFDGTRAPYAAAAAPTPLSVYGRTKAAAETAVLRAPAALVVRLPLLFGRSPDGRRGATDMIRRAAEGGGRVTLYTDEYRTPLHVADAAAALVALALDTECTGVLHAAGSERLSRFEFGQRFVAAVGLDPTVLVGAPCGDPTRPRDVSLVGDRAPTRGLDAALGES